MKPIRNLLQLCLLCAFLILPAAVRAQFTFVISGGAVTITGYTGSGGPVVIPDWTNGYPVTDIAGNAFDVCPTVTSVTIGTNVTVIENNAIYRCSQMTNVTIPRSVISIGVIAISDCNSLIAITVASNNPTYSSVNGVLFDKAQKTLLTYPGGLPGGYTIPSSVNSIGLYAFYACAGVTNVTIGNSVTNVGDLAFNGCSSLMNVTLSNSVIGIGSRVFSDCPSLGAITVDPNNPAYSSVAGVLFDKPQTTLIQCAGGKAGSYTVPGSVTNIGDYSFWGCNSLTNVAIGNNVTRIGGGVFESCTKLTQAVIPDSVTTIGSELFISCSGLTSATIGAKVTNNVEYAFDNCSGLTNIMVAPLNSAYSSVAGILFNKSQTVLLLCPQAKAGSCTISNSVTSIGEYAFTDCNLLTGVYFEGRAPSADGTVFGGDHNSTVYYLPGTTGWNSTFAGRPVVPWNPQVQTRSASFGVQANKFGFNITGASNLVIVIETCTNLANSAWTPVGTNTLNTFVGTNGTSYFSDSKWTNHPGRFYRLRSPQ